MGWNTYCCLPSIWQRLHGANLKHVSEMHIFQNGTPQPIIKIERLCRAGPRGRARGRTTLGVHPWLLSNNRLEKVPFVSVPHTSSNRLLLSNQDKGCTPSVAHSLALPLGPALHNVWTVSGWHMFQNGMQYGVVMTGWRSLHAFCSYQAQFDKSATTECQLSLTTISLSDEIDFLFPIIHWYSLN